MIQGYRNMLLVLAAVITSTWIAMAGVQAGSDLVGLATIIGAKDACVVGAIFGRGYNKKVENGTAKP